MATDFIGYNADHVLHGWATEVVTIKRVAANGYDFEAVAENVACKPDGERQGMIVDDQVGALLGYTRRFFFGADYYDAQGNCLSLQDILRANDVIVDADGVEWRVESISNPAGLAEHLQVTGRREPVE